MSFVERFLAVRGHDPNAAAATLAAPHGEAVASDASTVACPGASRRTFIVASLAAGGGLVLAMSATAAAAAALDGVAADDDAPPADFAPNAFVRIGTDGSITIVAKHDEMGQGIHTGLAIALCEELEVDVSEVEVVPAPADPAYAHSAFGMQITGGSSSTYSSFEQMRTAGATAREMLVAAAAQQWGVEPSACEARDGAVHRTDGSASLAYGALASAAAGVAVPRDVALKQRKDWTRIGRPTKRVDSPAKVRGTATFSFDVRVEGMLTALVARSPYFGGTLRSFDAERARSMPGVRAIVEVPSGVAVVADGYWDALRARDALELDWDGGEAAALHTPDLRRRYRDLAERSGLVAEEVGSPEPRLAEAARRIDAVYEVPFQAHAPMEPLSCLVTLTADGGAHLVTGSQMLGVDRPTAAARLGVDPSRVTIDNQYLGGGFGRRANPASDFVLEAVEVALAAKDLGRPIKTVWTREDDIRGGWYRPMCMNGMSAVLDDAGIVAWRHRVVSQSIAEGTAFEAFMVQGGVDSTSVEGARHLPYAVPHRRVELHTPSLTVPIQWWRSVGHSNTAFAKESFLDEIAEALGRDPYDLRRELLAEQPRLRRVLDHAARAAGWDSALPPGVGRGISVHESFQGFCAQVVEASIEGGKPKIRRIVCAIDCGPVVNPDQVEAQMQGGVIFALSSILEGEITFEHGKVVQSNFHDFRLLRMHETPEIEVHIVESDDPMGGIGEVGVPPLASAVCSALRDAGGPRIRRLPIGDQLAS